MGISRVAFKEHGRVSMDTRDNVAGTTSVCGSRAGRPTKLGRLLVSLVAYGMQASPSRNAPARSSHDIYQASIQPPVDGR